MTNVALSYSLYIMIKNVSYWQYDSFIELCEIACSLTIVSSNNSNGTINQYYKEKITRARTVDNRGSGIPRLGQEISGRQHLNVQRRQIVITEGRNLTGRSQRSPTSDSPIKKKKDSSSLLLYCTVTCIELAGQRFIIYLKHYNRL